MDIIPYIYGMKNVFIERQIYNDLRKHLKKREITVLIGPRQSGKTVLMKKLKKELEAKQELVLYFNLDIVSDRQILENQTEFITFLKNKTGLKKSFIVIDEVQRLENPGLFLKGIYDLELPYKLLVSGSSALEIKSKISEALTGRKKIFYLTPLSFEEFSHFKNPDLSSLKSVKKAFYQQYSLLLDEYLRFGGYPEVVLQKTEREKIEILEEIYSSYLEKDIKGYFEVKNESSFLTVVGLLSGQIGNLLNRNLLATNSGVTRQTVDNFLLYLEKSFVINIVRPFSRNPEKEITKMPKIYFCDLGLRNLTIRNFTVFDERQDRGKLFENAVLLKLQKEIEIPDKINHWRTKTKAEVDFVISRGLETIPIEVKAKNLERPVYSKSFRSFLQKFSPENGVIVNLGLEKREKLGATLIHTRPVFEKILGWRG